MTINSVHKEKFTMKINKNLCVQEICVIFLLIEVVKLHGSSNSVYTEKFCSRRITE